MSIESKEALRASLFGSRNARIEEIEVDINGNTTKIGVKQPSILVQGQLANKLRRAAKAENLEEMNRVKVDFAIRTACDPESGELMLDDRDAQQMLAQPCASWVDRVYETAMKMMRSPATKTCDAEKADGSKCGGELTLGAPFCPHCGAAVPHPAEVAEKNS